jgi:N-methylhydantoinase A
MRYRGQGHEVRVPLPEGAPGPGSEPGLREGFERGYQAIYGRTAPGVPVDVVSWRVVAYGPRPGLRLGHIGGEHAPADTGRTGTAAIAGGAEPLDSSGASAALKGRRRAYVPEHGGFADVQVYDRYRLAPGQAFRGPAIVEERESTVVVAPGARVWVDGVLSLVIEDDRAADGTA